MLVWAGLIEAFLSQYHEPVIPYFAKIAFGCIELAMLVLFLSRSGRITSEEHRESRLILSQSDERPAPIATQ